MTDFKTLSLTVSAGVATIRFDNGELNLADEPMIRDLDAVVGRCAEDNAVRVLVFESANPNFFVAHADLNHLNTLPTHLEDGELFDFTRMIHRLRTMSKPSIAKIEGRARGGGTEIALACDMRFGAIGACVMGLPEVSSGIIPGGGGTVHLPPLVGHGRAIEILIGGGDFPAELAERYGLINRALPADEIGAFVDRLARRIARFPVESVRAAKSLIGGAANDHLALLLAERAKFMPLLTPERRKALLAALDVGMQTVAVETLCFDDIYDMGQG